MYPELFLSYVVSRGGWSTWYCLLQQTGMCVLWSWVLYVLVLCTFAMCMCVELFVTVDRYVCTMIMSIICTCTLYLCNVYVCGLTLLINYKMYQILLFIDYNYEYIYTIYIHTCTYIHRYIHTYVHTYIHTYIHCLGYTKGRRTHFIRLVWVWISSVSSKCGQWEKNRRCWKQDTTGYHVTVMWSHLLS